MSVDCDFHKFSTKWNVKICIELQITDSLD